MKPRVLFIITSDPRTSARPAEAARIAAGVGVWKKTDISVYLREEAVRALADSTGDLTDEDIHRQCWPMLAGSIYAQKGAAALRGVEPAIVPFAEISDEQLAQLASEQNCVLRF